MSRSVSIFSVVVVMTITVLATVVVAFAQEEPENEGGGGPVGKVPVCHNTAHNPHTITVGAPAEAAHLAHGDTKGACETAGAPPEEPSEGATLTTEATLTPTLPDGTISDTATLSGATSDATGTISFSAYGPFDPATDPTTDVCDETTLAFESPDPVDIGSPDASGNYVVSSDDPAVTTDDFVPTEAGRYQWVASYSGDASNEAVLSECNAEGEQSVVSGEAGTTPTLTTDATDTATLPDGTISDTATLGPDVPDGTDGDIEFKLYGPFTTAPTAETAATDCVAANLVDTPSYTSTVAVDDHAAANNPYTSDLYTPTEAGIYQWTATFTPDSGQGDPSGEIGCGEAVEQSVVSDEAATTGAEQNMTLAGEIGEVANLADPATDTTNIEGTTQNGNTTLGTDSEDDVLYGNASANKLLGRHGNDYLDGGKGRDRMVGGKQADRINGADGKPGDVINGGIGIDYCVGDVGDEIKNCDGNVVNVPLPSEAAAPAEARN
ncbi:MAG: calcium-binding protein [Rubrobacteraceae bacterium]